MMKYALCAAVSLFVVETEFAGASIWYVDQNTLAPPSLQTGTEWSRAIPDLQTLFENPGFLTDTDPEVWVANGTYKPSAQYLELGEPDDARKVTFLIPSGVEIYGGFKGQTSASDPGEQNRSERMPELSLTILSGDIAGDDVESVFPDGNTYSDNAYHVVTIPIARIARGPTRLSGLIIRGGYADEPNFVHNVGGGIKSQMVEPDPCNDPYGNVQFSRVVFKYNYAAASGGGSYISIKDRPYYIANCRYENNYAANGGGLYSDSAIVELMNCIFFDNHVVGGTGGGVYIAGGTATDTTRDVSNCTFVKNTTDAAEGGGLFANVQVHDDELCPPSPPCQPPNPETLPPCRPGVFVRNTIFWDNEPNQLEQSLAIDSVIVESSIVEGGWTGICNSDQDPLFSGIGSGALRPQPGSPAIDMGNVNGVKPDNTDANDNNAIEQRIPWDFDPQTQRILPFEPAGCRVDIGAYEDQCVCLGDSNGDRVVSLQDLAELLACYGLSVICTDGCYIKDIDCSGTVDLQDLGYLLSNFGMTCCSPLEGGNGFADSMSPDSSDPLTEWLQQATPQEVVDWWNAGMPVGGEDR